MDIAAKPPTQSRMKPIAVVQGADGPAIQQLLADCFARWHGQARIVGLIEDRPGDGCSGAPDHTRNLGHTRNLAHLRNLAGGRSFPIFQDLGPGSTGCALDGPSLVEAGEQVRRDIAGGCDLVVLSKFGKFEAEHGSGLLPAFVDALEAGALVLTSVAPKFMVAWDNFADPFYVVILADPVAIDAWWTEARRNTAGRQ